MILSVPLLDVTLVALTRLWKGTPVSQGGRDHSSHRLVQLGLSERATVLLLYSLSAAAAIGGWLLGEKWALPIAMVLTPILWVGLGLFFAFLARPRLDPIDTTPITSNNLILGMAFKRRLLEVVTDLGLAFSCLSFAYLLRFDFALPALYQDQLLASLPWTLGLTILSFQVCGLYKGLWEHQGIRDVSRFAKGAALASVSSLLVAVIAYNFKDYPRSVFPLYSVLLFLGVLLSRGSYRMLDLALRRDVSGTSPVIMYGIGGPSEIAFREVTSGSYGMRVVGFLTDDKHKVGSQVHGKPILGTPDQLEKLAKKTVFDRIIIAKIDATGPLFDRFLHRAFRLDKKVSVFRATIEEVQPSVGLPNEE